MANIEVRLIITLLVAAVSFSPAYGWNLKGEKTKRADWTPTKVTVESADKSWCTVDKQMHVKYDNKTIKCGKTYNTSLFQSAPSVVLDRANANRYYTFIMLDPDAPSRDNPTQRSWLHWLIVNIEDSDIKKGFEVIGYSPPTPPPGSGPHRYIFLSLKQYQKQTDYVPITDRGKFDVNEYAEDYKLTSLSGFTYFETENKKNEE